MESPTRPAGSRDEREVSSPPPAGGGRPRSLANLMVAEIQKMAQDAGRAAFEVALDTKVGASMIVDGKVVWVVRAGREDPVSLSERTGFESGSVVAVAANS